MLARYRDICGLSVIPGTSPKYLEVKSLSSFFAVVLNDSVHLQGPTKFAAFVVPKTQTGKRPIRRLVFGRMKWFTRIKFYLIVSGSSSPRFIIS